MKNSILIVLACLLFLTPLFAGESDPIEFSGGYTRVSLLEGSETVILTGGASLSSGSVQITAGSIEISGTNYRYVSCTDNVKVIDTERGITLYAPALYYDREEAYFLVDGWVEVQDTKNEVAASGAWMEYHFENGTMQLQMQVRLLKHTERGALICRADIVSYNSEENSLALVGNASVLWGKDEYEAAIITVDLTTEEIIMDGGIKGTVHG